MLMVTRALILDKVVCIAQSAVTLRKTMTPFIHVSPMGK